MSGEIIHVKLQTHIGGRTENQDCASSIDTPLGKVILVCDGMGGAKGGAVASELAIKVIKDEIETATKSSNIQQVLNNAILNANKSIYTQSQSNDNLRGMGTTLAGVLITKEKAIVFHVGDSRVYLVRNGKIVFKTTDHSFVSEQLAAGLITEEEAIFHPRGNEITRALGIKKEVNFEIQEIAFKKGDKFVLSSDGVHGEILEDDLISFVQSNAALDKMAERIISAADVKGRKRKNGKHDNMTIAIGETLVASSQKALGSSEKSNSLNWKYLLLIPLAFVGAYFARGFLSNSELTKENGEGFSINNSLEGEEGSSTKEIGFEDDEGEGSGEEEVKEKGKSNFNNDPSKKTSDSRKKSVSSNSNDENINGERSNPTSSVNKKTTSSDGELIKIQDQIPDDSKNNVDSNDIVTKNVENPNSQSKETEEVEDPIKDTDRKGINEEIVKKGKEGYKNIDQANEKKEQEIINEQEYQEMESAMEKWKILKNEEGMETFFRDVRSNARGKVVDDQIDETKNLIADFHEWAPSIFDEPYGKKIKLKEHEYNYRYYDKTMSKMKKIENNIKELCSILRGKKCII